MEKIKSTQLFESTNVELSFRERVSYAVGEFGYNSIYFWVSAYMLIFYTDIVGVAVASVSTLILVVRIFDAINDPLIGSLADRSKSRFGRYKPWVGFGAVALSIFIVMLFAAQPTWSNTTKVVYMWVVYIAVTVASTCCNMPFGALNGVITSNGMERQKLSSMRMVFANLGAQFSSLVGIPLILVFTATSGVADQRGYMGAVIFCVVLGLPTLIWSSVKSKERMQPPPSQTTIPLGKQFSSFFQNKYIIMAFLAQVVNGFNAYGRMGMLLYYFTYVANDATLMSVQGIVGVVCGIFGAGFLGTYVFKRIHSKGKTMQICMGGAAVGFAALFFLDPNSVVFWIVSAVALFFQAGASATGYSLIPDAIDYGEYKTGVRCDGFLAAIVSFGLKTGGAIGPAVMLAWISAIGYAANIAQNGQVLSALTSCISIIPAVCCLAMVVMYFFWDMSEKKHEEIRIELDKRRQV